MPPDCPCTPPEDVPQIISPELAKELAEEGYELRKEFEKRLAKMWTIPVEERLAISR